MTATDLITRALKRLGVLQPTEAPSSEDAEASLEILNELIDAWKLQRLMIASITRTTWTIAANDGSYTLGTGGQINTTRPSVANDVTVKFIDTTTNPDTEHKLTVLTDDAYEAIPQKAATAIWPVAAWLNATFGASDTGLSTLELWPVPTSSDLQGVLYAPTPLGELATLTTDFYAPPGYRQLYTTNLLLKLAPVFNRPVTQAMKDDATEATANVKRVNTRLTDLSIDIALVGGGSRMNIETGL